MAMMVKYRIHEVAKDFNTTSKVISQILTDYIAAPKNHMQVLDTPELDIIFEYMTQHNQAQSLEDIFRTAPSAEPQKETAEAKKPAAAAGAKAGKADAGKQAGAAGKKPAQQPAAQEPVRQQQKKENKPHRSL